MVGVDVAEDTAEWSHLVSLPQASEVRVTPLDVEAIRSHFFFPERGRIVTNNAASTQPPRELVQLYQTSRRVMRTYIVASPTHRRR